MRILGIGVDIIKNKRIRSLIKNETFISRIFSKNEIINSKKFSNKTNYYSKRFAAKESFTKAIGSGVRDGLNFKDIEISNDTYGKPYYVLNKKIKKFILKKKKLKIIICFFQFLMKKIIQ